MTRRFFGSVFTAFLICSSATYWQESIQENPAAPDPNLCLKLFKKNKQEIWDIVIASDDLDMADLYKINDRKANIKQLSKKCKWDEKNHAGWENSSRNDKFAGRREGQRSGNDSSRKEASFVRPPIVTPPLNPRAVSAPGPMPELFPFYRPPLINEAESKPQSQNYGKINFVGDSKGQKKEGNDKMKKGFSGRENSKIKKIEIKNENQNQPKKENFGKDFFQNSKFESNHLNSQISKQKESPLQNFKQAPFKQETQNFSDLNKKISPPNEFKQDALKNKDFPSFNLSQNMRNFDWQKQNKIALEVPKQFVLKKETPNGFVSQQEQPISHNFLSKDIASNQKNLPDFKTNQISQFDPKASQERLQTIQRRTIQKGDFKLIDFQPKNQQGQPQNQIFKASQPDQNFIQQIKNPRLNRALNKQSTQKAEQQPRQFLKEIFQGKTQEGTLANENQLIRRAFSQIIRKSRASKTQTQAQTNAAKEAPKQDTQQIAVGEPTQQKNEASQTEATKPATKESPQVNTQTTAQEKSGAISETTAQKGNEIIKEKLPSEQTKDPVQAVIDSLKSSASQTIIDKPTQTIIEAPKPTTSDPSKQVEALLKNLESVAETPKPETPKTTTSTTNSSQQESAVKIPNQSWGQDPQAKSPVEKNTQKPSNPPAQTTGKNTKTQTQAPTSKTSSQSINDPSGTLTNVFTSQIKNKQNQKTTQTAAEIPGQTQNQTILNPEISAGINSTSNTQTPQSLVNIPVQTLKEAINTLPNDSSQQITQVSKIEEQQTVSKIPIQVVPEVSSVISNNALQKTADSYISTIFDTPTQQTQQSINISPIQSGFVSPTSTPFDQFQQMIATTNSQSKSQTQIPQTTNVVEIPSQTQSQIILNPQTFAGVTSTTNTQTPQFVFEVPTQTVKETTNTIPINSPQQIAKIPIQVVPETSPVVNNNPPQKTADSYISTIFDTPTQQTQQSITISPIQSGFVSPTSTPFDQFQQMIATTNSQSKSRSQTQTQQPNPPFVELLTQPTFNSPKSSTSDLQPIIENSPATIIQTPIIIEPTPQTTQSLPQETQQTVINVPIQTATEPAAAPKSTPATNQGSKSTGSTNNFANIFGNVTTPSQPSKGSTTQSTTTSSTNPPSKPTTTKTSSFNFTTQKTAATP